MLSRDDLLSLEDYEVQRPEIRRETIEAKKERYIGLGDHISLLFESRDTVFYQVMEMLRIEKTTDAEAIDEELHAYNPLIPDGSNLKATMLIEYEDETERAIQLKNLHGIEDRIWAKVGDSDPVYAIADEDMDRSDDHKTSAVHFLRFEFDADRVKALKEGASLEFGSSHPHYSYKSWTLETASREELVADLK